MSSTAFRYLVLASLVLPFGTFIDLVFPNLLPAALATARDAEPVPGFIDQWWFIAIAFAFAACGIAAAIGLLYFRRWARTLSLWTTVFGLFTYPAFGASASSGVAASVSEAASMLWGAVLAIAYFSPLRKHFKSKT